MQVCQAESKENDFISLSQRERDCLFASGSVLLRSKKQGEWIERCVSTQQIGFGVEKETSV